MGLHVRLQDRVRVRRRLLVATRGAQLQAYVAPDCRADRRANGPTHWHANDTHRFSHRIADDARRDRLTFGEPNRRALGSAYCCSHSHTNGIYRHSHLVTNVTRCNGFTFSKPKGLGRAHEYAYKFTSGGEQHNAAFSHAN